MLQAVENLPLNFGFLGKGNSSRPEALEEQVLAGAAGLKLHEDWGTTPQAIRTCLTVADEMDVPVAHPHRHPERVRFRRGLTSGLRGTHYPHLSYRGGWRRPRPGHHQAVRRAERAAE